MTDQFTAAREAAINFEAKLYAFRKTKEGTVVSFVVHPNDMTDKLAILDIGARVVIAAVELADDETPKE
jgi:uncharacterized OB-fold protein